MAYTEKEARARWCPLQRNAIREKGHFIPLAVNVWPGGISSCMGSQCMMWRWEHVGTLNATPENPTNAEGKSTQRGYCGLAGAERLYL